MSQNSEPENKHQDGAAPRYCKQCGSAFNSGTSFCPKCGAAVVSAERANAGSPTPPAFQTQTPYQYTGAVSTADALSGRQYIPERRWPENKNIPNGRPYRLRRTGDPCGRSFPARTYPGCRPDRCCSGPRRPFSGSADYGKKRRIDDRAAAVRWSGYIVCPADRVYAPGPRDGQQPGQSERG